MTFMALVNSLTADARSGLYGAQNHSPYVSLP